MLWLISSMLIGLASAVGKNWAVLVAGSNGWGNYRHQADVCHAFHILHDIGKIPAEQIVVMMADDIANNDENPFPGNIINIPNGPNVYPGVNKNVTGEDVTAKNFLRVLHELPSTSEDNVFIYFTDHGAKGLVAMPFGDPLYADEFNDALKEMHKRRKYNQMVVYVEACESGSMFDKILDDDLSIYATTASDDDHSSYAYYFDEKRGVYLADLYSINWMQDSQYNMTSGETLLHQFDLVKALTNESTVEEFGDLSIQQEPVQFFQGDGFFSREEENPLVEEENVRRREENDLLNMSKMLKASKTKIKAINKNQGPSGKQKRQSPAARLRTAEMDLTQLVDSRDVGIATLLNRMKVATYEGNIELGKQLGQQISEEFQYRQNVDLAFEKIIKQVVTSDNRYPQEKTDVKHWYDMKRDLVRKDYDCLRMMVGLYQETCYRGLEDYSMKYVRVLANLCTVYELHPDPVKQIMTASC